MPLTKELLFAILDERFDNIDYDEARKDAKPFIKDQRNLDLWRSEFFKSITRSIKV